MGERGEMRTWSGAFSASPRRRRGLWVVLVVCLAGTLGGVGAASAATVIEFRAGISGGLQGITAGADGNLWFTEFNIARGPLINGERVPRIYGDRVGRITPAGVVTEFHAGLTAGSGPKGITAGPDGNLWFTELQGGRVGRITPAGVVTEFPGFKSGSGSLGIAAGPDGNLWFAGLGDPGDGGVGRITPAGKFTQFGADIGDLEGIAAGPDGNLWFTLPAQDHVGRITPAGGVTLFPAGGGQNSDPVEITAGPDGNLWFTDDLTDRVGRITPSGKVTSFSAGITTGSSPQGIAAGADGNLWFTESNDGRVARITPTGKVTEFSAGITPGGAALAEIATGPDGNLWFTEGDRIGRITTTTGPAVAIRTRRARVSAHGATQIELACGPGTGSCAGKLILTAAIDIQQRRRTISKTISVATTHFSLPAGQLDPVKLTLSRTAQLSVAHAQHRRLSTQARAITTSGDAHRTLTLTR